jgi:alkaline phosphatase
MMALSGWFFTGQADAANAANPSAKNIILFIGDGMQLEHEIATSRYLTGTDDGLIFHAFPYTSYVSTWDVTTYNKYRASFGADLYSEAGFDPRVGYDPYQGGAKPYPAQQNHIDDWYFVNFDTKATRATDSASAATAWATGKKTDDGNIAWKSGDPPDGALTTIAELLREKQGKSIGVVSTVPFSHATPAAHVSHNKSRNNYHAISEEIINTTKPEVVIGGGFPYGGSFSYISPAAYAAIQASPEYVYVGRTAGQDGSTNLMAAADQAVAQKKNLFGLFGGPGGNFESPVPIDAPGAPEVHQATSENPLLKDATTAALRVLSQDPDGFFVMIEQGDIDWANHANDFARMVGTTWDLNEAVKTAMDFVNEPGDDVTLENTLILVTSDHGNSFMRLNPDMPLGLGDLPAQSGSSYPDGEVTYGTGNHTNELCTLYAIGGKGSVPLLKKYEGSWYPGTRIVDNTQLYHVMAEAAGVAQEDRYPELHAIVEGPPVEFAWGTR